MKKKKVTKTFETKGKVLTGADGCALYSAKDGFVNPAVIVEGWLEKIKGSKTVKLKITLEHE